LVSLKGQEAFAGNHLEVSLFVLPADIATVNPDRKRTVESRKFVPAALAAFDETALFVAQFPLQPLCHIRDMLDRAIGDSYRSGRLFGRPSL
jgi:hypothetical protein